MATKTIYNIVITDKLVILENSQIELVYFHYLYLKVPIISVTLSRAAAQ